jgi:hypothetical protein
MDAGVGLRDAEIDLLFFVSAKAEDLDHYEHS